MGANKVDYFSLLPFLAFMHGVETNREGRSSHTCQGGKRAGATAPQYGDQDLPAVGLGRIFFSFP